MYALTLVMRKRPFRLLTLLFILCAVHYSAKAQTWFPIAAKWYYYIPQYIGTWGPTGAIKIEVVKDTVINSTQCKLLSQLYYPHQNDSTWEANIYAYEKNDSVYFLRNDTFILTYDFSLPIGDSISMRNYYDGADSLPGNVCPQADTFMRLPITSSGVISANGQTLRYYTSSGFTVIEKLGSTEFIYPYYNCLLDYTQPQLACYFDSLVGTYQIDSTLPCFSFPTAVSDLSNSLSLKLFPNPAQSYAVIQLDENSIGAAVQINDAEGRMVAKYKMANNTLQIATGSFSSGVYFVRVTDNTGLSIVRKLVIE